MTNKDLEPCQPLLNHRVGKPKQRLVCSIPIASPGPQFSLQQILPWQYLCSTLHVEIPGEQSGLDETGLDVISAIWEQECQRYL